MRKDSTFKSRSVKRRCLQNWLLDLPLDAPKIIFVRELIRGSWATILASGHGIDCDHQLGANVRPCIAVVLYTRIGI